MKIKDLNQKQGVAGLNVFLSIIAMLFMIGIIVMVFILAGTKISEQVTDATASEAINDTVTSMSTVPDWFPTIIVLGAMVVLILLVVIIINSIRGSGITEGA